METLPATSFIEVIFLPLRIMSFTTLRPSSRFHFDGQFEDDDSWLFAVDDSAVSDLLRPGPGPGGLRGEIRAKLLKNIFLSLEKPLTEARLVLVGEHQWPTEFVIASAVPKQFISAFRPGDD